MYSRWFSSFEFRNKINFHTAFDQVRENMDSCYSKRQSYRYTGCRGVAMCPHLSTLAEHERPLNIGIVCAVSQGYTAKHNWCIAAVGYRLLLGRMESNDDRNGKLPQLPLVFRMAPAGRKRFVVGTGRRQKPARALRLLASPSTGSLPRLLLSASVRQQRPNGVRRNQKKGPRGVYSKLHIAFQQ